MKGFDMLTRLNAVEKFYFIIVMFCIAVTGGCQMPDKIEVQPEDFIDNTNNAVAMLFYI